MKKLVLVLVILSSMVLSVSCGGENGGSGSVGTATFNNQNLNSFVGLPPEVVEQFQNNIKGKSFEEIYSYALAQGIDIIVTQVEDLQYFDTQYFNIPDQYTNKNEAVTTYFRRVSEISNCTAYFDFSPNEGFTTRPAIYLKKKPRVDTVYHEMIHALEFLNSSTHMKSEYFSEFVDLEELQSALVPLFKELVHLENTYKSERDRLLKQRLYKAYLLTTMGYCMVKLFVEYLKVRQHIFLTKYLYDTAQNNYDRFQNLSSIQAYLRELKSELHVINNGGVVVGLLGDKKVYDYLNSTIRDFEAVATLEEKVQTKFEDIKKNIFQDIEAIKRESQNLISSFEAWSIPKSFDVIRYR